MDHAAQTASAISWSDLPCGQPGRSARSHLRKRCRSARFSQDAGAGLPEDGVAGACVLPHEQPFSPGGRNAQCQPGGRYALASERLHHPAQPSDKLFGHVFGGRYKALLVEGGGTGYLKTACDYVHLNPVRARLLQREERLPGYPWSSLMWYLAVPKHRPAWMRIDRLLGEHGIMRDNGAGRAELERRMDACSGEGIGQRESQPAWRENKCKIKNAMV